MRGLYSTVRVEYVPEGMNDRGRYLRTRKVDMSKAIFHFKRLGSCERAADSKGSKASEGRLTRTLKRGEFNVCPSGPFGPSGRLLKKRKRLPGDQGIVLDLLLNDSDFPNVVQISDFWFGENDMGQLNT